LETLQPLKLGHKTGTPFSNHCCNIGLNGVRAQFVQLIFRLGAE
jgi:hypothetical protein